MRILHDCGHKNPRRWTLVLPVLSCKSTGGEPVHGEPPPTANGFITACRGGASGQPLPAPRVRFGFGCSMMLYSRCVRCTGGGGPPGVRPLGTGGCRPAPTGNDGEGAARSPVRSTARSAIRKQRGIETAEDCLLLVACHRVRPRLSIRRQPVGAFRQPGCSGIYTARPESVALRGPLSRSRELYSADLALSKPLEGAPAWRQTSRRGFGAPPGWRKLYKQLYSTDIT